MSLPLLRRPKRRKEHHIPAVNTLMCHKNRMLTWLVQTVEDGGLNFLFGSSVHPSGHLTPCTAQTSQCNMKKTPPTSPWQPPLVLNMLQLAGKKYSINFNVCVCVWLNCMKVKINLFYRNTFLCIYLQSLVNTDSALWLAVCKNLINKKKGESIKGEKKPSAGLFSWTTLEKQQNHRLCLKQ